VDKRKLEENIFKSLMIFSTLIVVGSLGVILFTIVIKGLPALNLNMLTKTPKGGYYLGKEGGILNAILGSLVLGIFSTFLAFLVSLPVVFYLNLYLKKNSKFALLVRFFLDVLWGIPSIVYGAFGFTVMVFFGLRASLLAGTITVALLIIPIMARSIDEVLKMIPPELKEASLALGATQFETAKGVIFNVAGGDDLTMMEINEAAKLITDSIDPNAKVIFGAVTDKQLKKGEIKITVIAAGFGDQAPRKENQERREKPEVKTESAMPRQDAPVIAQPKKQPDFASQISQIEKSILGSKTERIGNGNHQDSIFTENDIEILQQNRINRKIEKMFRDRSDDSNLNLTQKKVRYVLFE